MSSSPGGIGWCGDPHQMFDACTNVVAAVRVDLAAIAAPRSADAARSLAIGDRVTAPLGDRVTAPLARNGKPGQPMAIPVRMEMLWDCAAATVR